MSKFAQQIRLISEQPSHLLQHLVYGLQLRVVDIEDVQEPAAR